MPAIGLLQDGGANITGFSGPVAPDRGPTTNRRPSTRVAAFGDGYEQREKVGINNLKDTFVLSFTNRVNTEIDDLDLFFEGLEGTALLTYRKSNSNGSPDVTDVSVVCETWNIREPNEGVKTLTATFRRVYEP